MKTLAYKRKFWLAAGIIACCAALTNVYVHAAEFKAVHIHPAQVIGGEPIEVTVSLTKTGIAHPEIRSALPQIVPIPVQTIAIVNKSFGTRSFTTNIVTQAQPVVIVATLGGQTASGVVTVLPPVPGRRHEIDAPQMSYLLKLARENGFQFIASKILRDTVDCRIDANAREGITLEVIRPKAPSIVDTVGACQFLLFGNRTLAPGFSLDASASPLRRSNGIGVSWRFSQAPVDGPDMRMTLTAENKDPYIKAAVRINKIVINGPPGSSWEDAFR